jgi:ABC-type Fe3+ transport system permease subunit
MENNRLLNNRLPYGNTKLILGIASLVLSPVLIGFILGIISVYLIDKDTKMLQSNRERYNTDALKNHKEGVIFAWIGFAVSTLLTLVIVYLFSKYGTLDMERINAIRSSKG